MQSWKQTLTILSSSISHISFHKTYQSFPLYRSIASIYCFSLTLTSSTTSDGMLRPGLRSSNSSSFSSTNLRSSTSNSSLRNESNPESSSKRISKSSSSSSISSSSTSTCTQNAAPSTPIRKSGLDPSVSFQDAVGINHSSVNDNNNNIKDHNNNNPGQSSNVVVVVRVRPPPTTTTTTEVEDYNQIWSLSKSTNKIIPTDSHPSLSKRNPNSNTNNSNEDSSETYNFQFDSLLLPTDSTNETYEENIKPLIKASIEGYNSTIFAYGQTGSGKTHTMMGTEDEPGIITRAVQDVWKAIEEVSLNAERGSSIGMNKKSGLARFTI